MTDGVAAIVSVLDVTQFSNDDGGRQRTREMIVSSGAFVAHYEHAAGIGRG